MHAHMPKARPVPRRGKGSDSHALPDVTLNAALLCENVIEEKDGTLSALRIIDRVALQVSLPSKNESLPIPPLPVNAVFLLVFRKQVDEERSFTAAVVTTGPSGKETAIASLPVTMPAGIGKGQNVVLRLLFGVQDTGTYWLTVRVDGTVLARVPLEILITRATPPAAS